MGTADSFLHSAPRCLCSSFHCALLLTHRLLQVLSRRGRNGNLPPLSLLCHMHEKRGRCSVRRCEATRGGRGPGPSTCLSRTTGARTLTTPRRLGQGAAAALPGPRASRADPARPHKPQKRKTSRHLRTAADGRRAGLPGSRSAPVTLSWKVAR